MKDENEALFNQLKEYAAITHRDYDPFDLPPASGAKYLGYLL